MSTQLKPQYSNLGFDPDALREKYRQERDKRIRPEGNDQYVEVTGKFAHFVDDPYVAPGFTRDPLTDEIDIVIIGGGFGGLLAGARFREAGLNNFRIIEAGGDFGGTWYWNRYPGAQCDIEVVLLSAAARRTRLHAEGEVLLRTGDLRALAAHRQHVQSLRDGVLPDQSDQPALGRRHRALDRLHRPRRRHEGALRGDGDRAAEPAEAAVGAGHRRVRGPHVPHQSLGLQLHRRRSQRRSHETGRQARRDHRHRCNGDSERAARRRPRETPVRVSTHAVVGGLARQQTDRYELGEVVEAGLAARAAREFQCDGHRPADVRRPRQRRLDRDLPHAREHDSEEERSADFAGGSRRCWPNWPTSRR